MVNQPKKPTSLRLILISWFIVFSIVPLALVSWYSLHNFQKAIESEQLQRLKANAREIDVIFSDYHHHLIKNRQTFANSPQFTYSLSIADLAVLKELSNDWMNNNIISSLAIYNRAGRRLSHAVRHDSNSVSVFQSPDESSTLDKKHLAHLADKKDLGIINKDIVGGFELILFSKVTSGVGKIIGYVEQKISLKDDFLKNIKRRLKIEILLLKDDSQIVAGTLPLENRNFRQIVESREITADSLEVKNNDNYYVFMMYPVIWDRSGIDLAIGASKKESQLVIKNVNMAFLGVISLVILFLIVTILISTSLLLKPINELIEGLRAFEKTDSLVQLAVKNKTEIGLLTSTFNQMSFKIFKARNDLKNKIKELERSNSNLKEAQTKLVHSAKMTSLGQLVAGVAHELNNPIGFIYSNTIYLQEYSEKLFKVVDEIEKDPAQSQTIKKKYEYDYIKTDLPLLIKSCQDGAQRTRDVVIGLRNFSRLEESQLKEIDIRESLDTTLDLLKGEIKNRIKIHRNYDNIPPVFCYASQINQVLMNLLSNAVQAISGNGQIWIAVSLLKASARGEGSVQISIQDTGVGMGPEVIDKIFEPFFTTKDVGQGTGLGLSISYGIIHNHRGDIQVKSEKGIGTEFVLTIPLSQKRKRSVSM